MRNENREYTTEMRQNAVDMTTGSTEQADPAGSPRTYEVRTFGCQMNVHDSERLAGLLEDAGYVSAAEYGAHAGADAASRWIS